MPTLATETFRAAHTCAQDNSPNATSTAAATDVATDSTAGAAARACAAPAVHRASSAAEVDGTTPPTGHARIARTEDGDRSRVARRRRWFVRPSRCWLSFGFGAGRASMARFVSGALTRRADTSAARARRRRRAGLLAVVMVVAGLYAASTPASAFAQDAGVVLAQAQSIDQVLTNIRNWLVGIAAGVATVFATIGMTRYMMADDPGEAQRAKNQLRNAGIGFAGVVLIPVLLLILQGFLGL